MTASDTFISGKLLERRVWGAIRNIKDIMQWSDWELADRMGLTVSAYENYKRIGGLPISNILSFSDSVDLSLTDLLSFPPSAEEFKRKFKQDPTEIPEEYQLAAYSRRRTAAGMIHYCDSSFGPSVTDRILRSLGVKRVALAYEDLFISVKFAIDFLDALNAWGRLDLQAINGVGKHFFISNAGAGLKAQFSQCKTKKDVYEQFFSEIGSHLEMNAHYGLYFVSDNRLIVRMQEGDAIKEMDYRDSFSSLNLCSYRAGVAGGIATLAGHAPSASRQIKCRGRGDPMCLYEIDL